ncbi:MAG TPA: hypothetical protein VI279_02840 [Rhodocyclaceae bacterium]
MSESLTPYLVLCGLWLGYGTLHSLLASGRCKAYAAAHWPRLVPAYRLAFNALALLLLLPILGFAYAQAGPWLWRWQGPWAGLAYALKAVAAAGFYLSVRYYDMDVFLGLRQWRSASHEVDGAERLRISPFHRYLRHPWYFLALLWLWSSDMNLASLLSVLSITLYFVIGSRLEERKLLARYGAAYARYQASVGGLLPVPWKRLSPAAAREIEAQALRGP